MNNGICILVMIFVITATVTTVVRFINESRRAERVLHMLDEGLEIAKKDPAKSKY